MRVAFDGRHASFAGIGRFTTDLWSALRRIEPEAFAFTTGRRGSGFLGEHEQPLEPPTVPLFSRPFLPTEQIEIPVSLRRRRAQVFHSPHFDMPFVTGVPVVLTIHDLFPLHYAEHARSRAAGAYYRHVMPRSIRRADRVVAISQFTYDDIRETLGIGEDRLRLVRPGLSIAHWRREPVSATSDATRHLPSPYLLHVGAVKWHKNLATVLAALSPDSPPLVCAGATREEIAQHADLDGCRGQVIALGRVSDADLGALYSGALAVVVASRYEALSMVALEAMATGVPVIASNGGALPETIGAAGLFVDPLDVDGWSEAFARIRDDDALRHELIRLGHEQVAQRDWDQAAAEYAAIYAEMLDGA